jgi:hypothetical protein
MSDPVEVKTIDLILENRQLIAENTELRKRVAELEKEIAVLNHEICPNGCGELTTIGTVPCSQSWECKVCGFVAEC